MKMGRTFRFLGVLAAMGALVWAPAGEAGQEFRGFNAIPTPSQAKQQEGAIAAAGYERASSATSLSPALVEKVVDDLFDSWNTPDLGAILTRDFANRSRILDAIQTGAPRYARLKVLAIQDLKIVDQYVRPHPSGDGSYQLLSRISVRIVCEVAQSTALTKRFQRLEGTSEYLIQVTQKVRAV